MVTFVVRVEPDKRSKFLIQIWNSALVENAFQKMVTNSFHADNHD